jgi:sugar/nucleoside kinase (ribokinase family)
MKIDYVTLSNLIIDDIVLPHGQTVMNTLGGAGLHALVGMRLWNDALGYAAVAGPDLDAEHRRALARFGVDTQGLIVRQDYQTARAWQVFEPDERRIEIFRTDLQAFERHKITLDELPHAYRRARGLHIQWGSLSEITEVVDTLRDATPGIALVLEPGPDHLQEPFSAFQSLLPHLTLFSPDQGEAELITGSIQPLEMCRALLNWGAPLVALRMGERGSLVANEDEAFLVPAVPASIVDVTGAGNAYCGGFLTGLGDDLSPLEAALRAAVSASFALEQFGLPEWTTPPHEEVLRRLAWARNRVKSVASNLTN